MHLDSLLFREPAAAILQGSKHCSRNIEVIALKDKRVTSAYLGTLFTGNIDLTYIYGRRIRKAGSM